MSKNQMAMAVSGVPQRENKIHPRAQKRAEVWARTSQKSRDLSKKSMTLSRLIDVGARRQHEDRMDYPRSGGGNADIQHQKSTDQQGEGRPLGERNDLRKMGGCPDDHYI